MQFLKKHYEKVLLSIVLLGLAAAAAALPWQVSHERERLEEISRNLTVKVKAKPFQPLDEWLTTNKAVVARLEAPLNLELAGPHNLFNPVIWKKMPDGRFLPIRTGSEMGPGAVKIAQMRELMLNISFAGVLPSSSPGDPPRYQVIISKETDSNPRPQTRTISMSTPRNDLFELVGVQGSTNDPTALILKLKDDYETITIPADKPFSRQIGFAADLVYPPGKQTLNNKRLDDTIRLEDDPETYKIVAINRNEVVLSANSNKRRTVIKQNASATPSSQ